MISIIPKSGNVTNVLKATSFAVPASHIIPVVLSPTKEPGSVKEYPFIPLTASGFNKNLSNGVICVSSGLSGKTQYRYAHTDIKIPDYTNSRRRLTRDPTARATDTAERRKNFTYVFTAVGATLATVLTKEILTKTAMYFWYSQDAMAVGTTEIDLSSVPEGKSVTFKWQGKPLFVRHRTKEEIELERATPLAELRDPQTDEARCEKPEFFIALGICTHLGCIPLANSGMIPGGYFCPCHGSHYDTAGRVRAGPAPLNLEIPPYSYIGDTTILVGSEK